MGYLWLSKIPLNLQFLDWLCLCGEKSVSFILIWQRNYEASMEYSEGRRKEGRAWRKDEGLDGELKGRVNNLTYEYNTLVDVKEAVSGSNIKLLQNLQWTFLVFLPESVNNSLGSVKFSNCSGCSCCCCGASLFCGVSVLMVLVVSSS